jgi:DNA mismatch endonuclease (patch repair protein)
MARRADELPNDPVLIDDDEPTKTFDERLAALDESTDADAGAEGSGVDRCEWFVSRLMSSTSWTDESENPTNNSHGDPPKRPQPSSPEVQRRMQQQRRRDTRPEMALRRALHRRGLRYRIDRQVIPGLRRRHDIVFSGARTIVEVHGCYWHACSVHGTRPKANAQWWATKLAVNAERDRITKERLVEAGWELVVVWEHDDVENSAGRVERIVRRRMRGDRGQGASPSGAAPTPAQSPLTVGPRSASV